MRENVTTTYNLREVHDDVTVDQFPGSRRNSKTRQQNRKQCRKCVRRNVKKHSSPPHEWTCNKLGKYEGNADNTGKLKSL